MNFLNKVSLIILAIALPALVYTQKKTSNIQKNMSDSTAPITTFLNDPFSVHTHTLANGLKIYISVNKDAPRIQTMIAVKTGSTNDPADATGLAHYLEHMMFKGTSKIGTIDWAKESVLLKEISDLYEEHRNEKDPIIRKALYQKIDSVSFEASKYAVPNEYDKMVAAIGASGTNAYTSMEQTVYINEIPSNELDKWLTIESERFSELVLRLFHTELETVYEEFNISQDVDTRKGNEALLKTLFPSHTYGTQTTIGEGEHLKNPSHQEIHKYFNQYYVPNNMAIILAGDVNPEEAIAKIEKHFGGFASKTVQHRTFEPQPDLKENVIKEVFGKEEEYLDIAFKIGGANSIDPKYLELISGILSNGKAGILDVELLQKQKVREAESWSWVLNDYSLLGIYAKPIEGQTLESLHALIQEQLDDIINGNFDEWLIEAVIKNKKLAQLKSIESNKSRANLLVSAYIKGTSWEEVIDWYDDMAKITKKDLINFAKKHLAKGHVAVYKRSGIDSTVMKVEKPSITAIPLNREFESEFYKTFNNLPESSDIQPVFVDFNKVVNEKKIGEGLSMLHVKNDINPLFYISYELDKGIFHDKHLSILAKYIEYLGTVDMSADDLKKELFKKALNLSFSADEQTFSIIIEGLDESYDDALAVLDMLTKIKGDQNILQNVVSDILQEREASKKDKGTILKRGMANYARYGKINPFNTRISKEDLKNLSDEALMSVYRDLLATSGTVYYFGPRSVEEISETFSRTNLLKQYKHPISKEIYPFSAQENTVNEIFIVDFPIVQTEVLMMSKGTEGFDEYQFVMNEIYNDYFGFGLSSIVFQEIRESKALAYSTYAYSGSPKDTIDPHFYQAYVGTQPDKLKEALSHLMTIIQDMPLSESQFEGAKSSIRKKIATERIISKQYLKSFVSNKKKNIKGDIRQVVFNELEGLTINELADYQQKYIKDRSYRIMILGDKNMLPLDYLKSQGEIKFLTMEEVFGY